MKNLKYFFLINVLLLMTACKEEQKPESYHGQTVFENYGKSHTYLLKDIKSDMGPENDLTECDSVSLLLPVIINDIDVKNLSDTILVRALGHFGTSPAEAIDKWLTETAAESGCQIDSININPNMADGFQFINGTIVNFNSQVLTYCIATSVLHPGAANGMYTLDYINYSLKENRIISLVDLFKKTALTELVDLIAKKAQENPRYEGEVQIETLPENNNFYLSSEGEIVFSYQPMEVGPHSLGNVQISFMPEELVALMTPQAIKEFGLSDLSE